MDPTTLSDTELNLLYYGAIEREATLYPSLAMLQENAALRNRLHAEKQRRYSLATQAQR